MGNYDRFEKLEMLGELDEKYIKEADAYLSQPFIADEGAVRLAPEKRKFSWQTFAVIAACAAVLIGGTIALKNYLSGRTNIPPVDSDSSDSSDNSSNTPDPYLEEIRERYQVSDDVKISYFEDGWEWKKFEVSGAGDGFGKYDISGRLLDGTAFIDDNTMLTVRTLDDGSEEIAAYDLTTKTFKTLFGNEDEAPHDGEQIRYVLEYANDDYIVFQATFGDNRSTHKKALRILNIGNSVSEWRYKTIIDDLGPNSIDRMLIDGNSLYLIVVPRDSVVPDKSYLCRYDILKEDDPEVIIEDVYYLFSLPDGIIYDLSERDDTDGLYHSHFYELETGKPIGVDLQMWRYVKNAGFIDVPADKLNTPDEHEPYTMKNLITNEEYLTMPWIYQGYRTQSIDTVSESCVIPRKFGDDHLILDCVTKELFVYKDNGLEIYDEGWDWRGYRDGFCVISGNDDECVGYILTRKARQEPVPDPYLAEIRERYRVSDDVKISHLWDNWEWKQYEIPGTENGFALYDFSGLLSSDCLFIDDNTILTVRTYPDRNQEIAAYDLTAKTFKTLFSKEDEAMDEGVVVEYRPAYADNNYIIFYALFYNYTADATEWKNRWALKQELRILNLRYSDTSDTSGNGWRYKTVISDMATNQAISPIVKDAIYDPIIKDNILYFIRTFEIEEELYERNIYRYDIQGGNEPELVLKDVLGLELMTGRLIYSNGTHSYELDTNKLIEAHEPALSSRRVKNAGDIGITDDEYLVKNLFTGETFLALPKIDRAPRIDWSSDDCIIPRIFGDDDCFILDCVNKELFVSRDDPFEIFDNKNYWCNNFGGDFYVVSGDDDLIEVSVLTRKTQTHTDNKPAPDPYLDGIREQLDISADVGIGYIRDSLSVNEYSLPQQWFFGAGTAAATGRLFIDNNRALTAYEAQREFIEMYLIDKNEVVTLIDAKDDPSADSSTLYSVYYANKDYVVFTRDYYIGYAMLRADLCVIELNKEGYPCTTIIKGSEFDALISYSNRNGGIFIDGNTLYYTLSENDGPPAIYRYEIGKDAEPVLCVEEGMPLCVCNGDLLYYTRTDGEYGVSSPEDFFKNRILHSESGTLPIEGIPYTEKMFACKYGVFKVEDSKLINCLTNKIILSDLPDPELLNFEVCDLGVAIGSGDVEIIYNARTNEFLVVEEYNPFPTLWSCRWGLCTNNYLICEK